MSARRHFFAASSAALAGVGLIAASVPIFESFKTQKASDTSKTLSVDIAHLVPGTFMTVSWQNKPVWILRRTEAMIADLQEENEHLKDPDSKVPQQMPACANATRSLRPDIAVILAICTHLGCTPLPKLKQNAAKMPEDLAQKEGGLWCACHGATFDLAGRVFQNKAASQNLIIPPHYYKSETELVIGVLS